MLKFGEKPISLMPPTNPEGLPARVLQRVGPFAEFVRTQREADTLIFGLIEERRQQAEQGDDVLAMLLGATHEDGTPMSEQELRDELLTLLVAGHETTASTLAWGFDRLSGHPEVVERLREDEDDYVAATIHEIMRRRPVIPNVAPRLVVKPIEVGGWSYPEGVCLVPNAYLVHHDPDIYPDPYAFRPERFLEQAPGTYTWIPFGGGRRRCLGASFAMLEMKVVLREVLRQRELQPVGSRFALPRRRNITVTPDNGAELRLPVRVKVPEAVALGG
jgi:cytochrome P450